MKITCVIPSIAYGGAEKILTLMANYWSIKGKKVTIITFEVAGTETFYNLSREVTLLQLGLFSDSKSLIAGGINNLRRTIKLRRAIKTTKPDVIVSFLLRTNIRVLLATLGLRTPVIVSDRSDPFLDSPGNPWSVLAKLTYLLAARIIVFTQHAASFYPAWLQRKVHVFPNPVLVSSKQPAYQNDNKNLVAVGRLEYEKGFDLLLKAFAKVQERFPQTKLTIWGEGSQRSKLEELTQRLNLTDSVSLPGTTKELETVLSAADVFVQSSRQEGFGNALCEAMAMGLPVISTNCSGPQAIVRDGVDGRLVPVEDMEALVETICDLLSHPQKRLQLSTNGVEISRRFNFEEIMKRWENLLAEVTA
ncbi:MAG TPA: glycosyltransferase family 4 protein [Blastocatellia bacterium]|nr:glycosyltransferase family 4 protein [Blastocatellia bacterium]